MSSLLTFMCYLTFIMCESADGGKFYHNYNPINFNPIRNPSTSSPDVLINNVSPVSSYNYPVPNPPQNFDEPPYNNNNNPNDHPLNNNDDPPINNDNEPPINYLPPSSINPPPSPLYPLPPHESDIIPTLLPEIPLNQYLPPPPPPLNYGTYKHAKHNEQIRVLNMSCLDTNKKKYFRANFRISSGLFYDKLPIIEGAKRDCIEMIGNGNNFVFNFNGNDFTDCGVKYCYDNERNMCVKIRFPTVRGIRLPEDFTIILQCKSQEVVATQTKLLRFHPQEIKGRSLSTKYSGGIQNSFDTRLTLYKRSIGSNEFNVLINSGDAVLLGEELLLRASVRDGDGWKYSKMGDVVMRHLINEGRLSQDFVTIIDPLGCRVPEMKSVCPEQPKQIDQLTTSLIFRAFMFEGTDKGEEMVLSVRMFGCLQEEHCIQTRICEEKLTGRTRAKRNLETNNNNNNDTIEKQERSNWESFISFKVNLPEKIDEKLINNDGNLIAKTNPIIIFAFLPGIISLITLIGVIVYRNYIYRR